MKNLVIKFNYSIGDAITVISNNKKETAKITGLFVALCGNRILRVIVNNDINNVIELSENMVNKSFYAKLNPCEVSFNYELDSIVRYKNKSVHITGLGVDASNLKYARVRYMTKRIYTVYESELKSLGDAFI